MNNDCSCDGDTGNMPSVLAGDKKVRLIGADLPSFSFAVENNNADASGNVLLTFGTPLGDEEIAGYTSTETHLHGATQAVSDLCVIQGKGAGSLKTFMTYLNKRIRTCGLAIKSISFSFEDNASGKRQANSVGKWVNLPLGVVSAQIMDAPISEVDFVNFKSVILDSPYSIGEGKGFGVPLQYGAKITITVKTSRGNAVNEFA